MQLENTHFILLVLFYLNSICLIPWQPGSFDVSPLAKHCWMLQHSMLYGKEWKTQKQTVVLVAFPATALLLLLNMVFCCGIVMRLHWQEVMWQARLGWGKPLWLHHYPWAPQTALCCLVAQCPHIFIPFLALPCLIDSFWVKKLL